MWQGADKWQTSSMLCSLSEEKEKKSFPRCARDFGGEGASACCVTLPAAGHAMEMAMLAEKVARLSSDRNMYVIALRTTDTKSIIRLPAIVAMGRLATFISVYS